ncbi:hypothetical protein M407DRAFT_246194 [Tulasnella calospora MUT 4182]|uniref:Endoplasmic reticulum vesicle transporter C-terminal domain-containing protein n=1 Tax=Tulasnella calospora MUT 4182 TaxID=1051891 RepID=A0A0C3LCW3_9AGAM|nr:hypothetical protein M407DRAFT_246194 [Tulasnella calospora MUT 4182]
MARGLLSGFKGFDAFGKTMEDVKIKTRTGALLTMLSAAIICTFTLVEFMDYRRVYVDTSVIVDRSRGERLSVSMNITFPQVPCFLLNLDVMDISGEHQEHLDHSLVKTRLNNQMERIDDGKVNQQLKGELDRLAAQRTEGYCGSCYGGLPPDSGCCQSCEDVRQAYLNRGWSFSNPDAIEQCTAEHWTERVHEMATEGCNLEGKVTVNKVIGNFHFSPGRSFLQNHFNIQELVPYLKDGNVHGFGHIIHKFEFENEGQKHNKHLTEEMKRRLGLVYSPLDTTGNFNPTHTYMYQYFLKVVGTQYHFIDGQASRSHQFSVTNYERDLTATEKDNAPVQTTHGIMGIPGVFFNYEISPMLIVHHERRQAFAHFLTSMCAIVGGVLTVASIVDSFLFRAHNVVKNSANGSTVKMM